MKVIVDSTIWSLVLRREKPVHDALARELEFLARGGRIAMLGIIRQEALSGIKSYKQYTALKKRLSIFPDVHIKSEDHELAAMFYNTCRDRGIQGSHTDYFLCAVSKRLQYPIFSTDRDFSRFAEVLSIRLHDFTR